MKWAAATLTACLMLWVITKGATAHPAETLQATLVSVSVTDWSPGTGRGVQVTLGLDDGRKVHFTHPLAASLEPGTALELHLSTSAGSGNGIPVVCRLETPGAVLDALGSPDCPRPGGTRRGRN